MLKSSKITSVSRAKRVIRVVVGFTVLFAGIALIVLPGPAVIVIPLGLAILAGEFVWARNLLSKFNSRIRGRAGKNKTGTSL